MRATRGFAVALAFMLPSCGGDSGSDPSPTPSGDPNCSAGAPLSGTPALTTTRIASGLDRPLDLQAPAGDRARVFIAEQSGRIRVVRGGTLLGTPFLDIASRISVGGERGLLGLAFHPRYLENGRFFVNYTDRDDNTHIAEFRAGPTADSADPASERLLLFVEQPFPNHKAGALAFGNDGFLYIALGDGGWRGDPLGNAQNPRTLLGKILRVDVDHGSPYAVPPDNPFVSRAGARPEIWALGLRNPFRFSVNAANGDLYIGDVGQGRREEIDVGVAAKGGGENYGWNIREGSLCFGPPSECAADFTAPVLDYAHEDGCAVIGGRVYNGCRMPGYHGSYFYGDHCETFIRSFRFSNGSVTDERDWTGALSRDVDRLSSFGVDADGELYLVDLEGEVHKVVPAN